MELIQLQQEDFTPDEIEEARRWVAEVEREATRELDLRERDRERSWAMAADTEAIQLDQLSEAEQPVEYVVEDLLPVGQRVLLCAEEGGGKTWLVHQLGHEASRGLPVLGEFAVPGHVTSVLIVDVEQTRQDFAVVCREMKDRGLYTADSNVFYLDAFDRKFDDLTPEGDLAWLMRQVAKLRPDILIIDTATNAVTDPLTDKSVLPFMRAMGWLLKHGFIRSFIGLAHPRKTGQARDTKTRDFDSLFGSHAWKAESSAVFWLTESRFTVWKQRGGYLKKRWGQPTNSRYAWAEVTRSDYGLPTVLSAPTEQQLQTPEEASAELDLVVASAIRIDPGISRTRLAAGVRRNKSAVLSAVERLLKAGTVTEPATGKLYVAEE